MFVFLLFFFYDDLMKNPSGVDFAL